MLRIDLRGLPEFNNLLTDIYTTQIPYATVLALNNVSFMLLDRSKLQLTSAFDNPTPLIRGATRVEKATKQNLSTVVYIDPKRAGVLKTHELGGHRGLQGLEAVARSNGLLPSGYRILPAKGLPLDQYGNPEGKYVTMTKKAIASKSWNVTATKRMFVIPVGSKASLTPGIYLEAKGTGGPAGYKNRTSKGRATRTYKMRQHEAMFVFLREGYYQQRLHWLNTMMAEAIKQTPVAVEQAISRVVATAKR